MANIVILLLTEVPLILSLHLVVPVSPAHCNTTKQLLDNYDVYGVYSVYSVYKDFQSLLMAYHIQKLYQIHVNFMEQACYAQMVV